jgi:phasin family protein
MAKKPQSDNPYDFASIMASFDPTKFAEEMTKAFQFPTMPHVDTEALIESQRKNIEALAAANQVAAEGMQAIYARQVQIMQQTMEEAQAVAEQFKDATDPRDAAAKQAEVAKIAYEKALSNMRELAEMTAKANAEAADAINTRIAASLDEMRTLAEKMKG